MSATRECNVVCDLPSSQIEGGRAVVILQRRQCHLDRLLVRSLLGFLVRRLDVLGEVGDHRVDVALVGGQAAAHRNVADGE